MRRVLYVRTGLEALVSQAIAWYLRYERHINLGAFVLGFLADAFIFASTDLVVSYTILALHLCVVGCGIFLINLREKRVTEGEFAELVEPWLPFLVQFSSGALMSGFTVLYTKSAVISENWPFLLILVGMVLANEFVRRRYLQMVFQVSVFYFAILSYAIVLVPYLLRQTGTDIFIASGALSLVVITLVVWALKVVAPRRFMASWKLLAVSIVLIFIFVNVLYFARLIPPVPLSLREIGVYHNVERLHGVYTLVTEPHTLRERIDAYFKGGVVRVKEGEPLFVFASVFSPANLDISVSHVWEKYDETDNTWVELARVTFPLFGGRSEGYRGYSEKLNVTAGQWRVSVMDQNDRLLGLVRFTVATSADDVPLVQETR